MSIPDLSPEQERQVAYIRRSAESLTELVNDLLDLAKIEAGKMTLHYEPVSLREVCEDAVLVAATTHQLAMPTLSGMQFDVVVIDEFHHAQAATYRRVLDRLRRSALQLQKRLKVRQ